MVQLGEHASPEVKKLLDEAGYSSTDKLKALARDPEKTKVFHEALAKYFRDPNSNAAEFASSELYKRDTNQMLSYYHDLEYLWLQQKHSHRISVTHLGKL